MFRTNASILNISSVFKKILAITILKQNEYYIKFGQIFLTPHPHTHTLWVPLLSHSENTSLESVTLLVSQRTPSKLLCMVVAQDWPQSNITKLSYSCFQGSSNKQLASWCLGEGSCCAGLLSGTQASFKIVKAPLE